MSRGRGWHKQSHRHSIAARRGWSNRRKLPKASKKRHEADIEAFKRDFKDYKGPFESKADRSKEYFFDEDDEMWVINPYGYLEDRYDVPKSQSKQLTLNFKRDKSGRLGVEKDQLDSIGRSFKSSKAHRPLTEEDKKRLAPIVYSGRNWNDLKKWERRYIYKNKDILLLRIGKSSGKKKRFEHDLVLTDPHIREGAPLKLPEHKRIPNPGKTDVGKHGFTSKRQYDVGEKKTYTEKQFPRKFKPSGKPIPPKPNKPKKQQPIPKKTEDMDYEELVEYFLKNSK